MQEESNRNAIEESNRNTINGIIVNDFINGILDRRFFPWKNIKEAHTLCRIAIENSLSKNPDIKKLISDNSWIKDLILDHALLKLHFFGILAEMDDSNKKDKPVIKNYMF